MYRENNCTLFQLDGSGEVSTAIRIRFQRTGYFNPEPVASEAFEGHVSRT